MLVPNVVVAQIVRPYPGFQRPMTVFARRPIPQMVSNGFNPIPIMMVSNGFNPIPIMMSKRFPEKNKDGNFLTGNFPPLRNSRSDFRQNRVFKYQYEYWPSVLQQQIEYLHEHIDHVEADIRKQSWKIRSLNRRVRKLEYDRDPKVLENSDEDFSDDDDEESRELERNVEHQDANIEIANLSSTFGGGIETEAKEIRSSPVLQKLLNKFRPEFS